MTHMSEKGEIMKALCLSALLVLVLSSVANAARIAPLENHENIEITGQSDKFLSLDDISKAIAIAAEAKNWKISDIKPGQATATLVVRGKHSITVSITYTEKTITVKYKDSINMNYDPAYKEYSSNKNEVGSPTNDPITAKVYEAIHPNYNVWVTELIKMIQVELMRMRS